MKKESLNFRFVLFIIIIAVSCQKEPNPSITTIGVTVNPRSLSMDAGNTDTLVATIDPANASNNIIYWKSSNSSIATVNSSGVVTAIGGGRATITATTADGNKKDSCIVKVMKWTTYTTSNGLINNYVFAIAVDAQGNKWFGTRGGISKFDGVNWTNYTTQDGLASNEVYSIAIDGQGNKWFGTSFGISKFDGVKWTRYSAPNNLASNMIISIAVDLKGNIWVGTYNGGISKFDGTTWTKYYENDHLNVFAIVIDKMGNKWFGTDYGAFKFNDLTWTRFSRDNGLRDNAVPSIAIDVSGNQWFGTSAGGLTKFDGTNWIHYSIGEGLFFAAKTVAIDGLGNVWIGQNGGMGGLAKFDGTNFITYKNWDKLISNYINTIFIDDKGNKWFGTLMSGVIKLED